MTRHIAVLGLLLVSCASAPKSGEEVTVTPPTVPALAPKDEPGLLLQGFETVDDLRGLHAANATIALGPEGVTQGEKALKITGVAPKDSKESSHGVRIAFAPPMSWSGMHELAVDVTNPEDTPQHLMVILADATVPMAERDKRRKAGLLVPAHATETMRVVLAGEWGTKQPLKDRSGRIAKDNGYALDLSKMHWLWIVSDKATNVGESFILDNLRLVRRDFNGVAISPTPPVRKPKLAVMDVQDLTGDLGNKAKLLTTLAYDEAASTKTADLISTADVNEMLGLERQKQLLGCTDGMCLADIGGALGADYLLTSQVGKLGSRVRVDARIVDARKGKVLAIAGDFAAANNDDAIADLMQRMVRKALGDSPLAPKP